MGNCCHKSKVVKNLPRIDVETGEKTNIYDSINENNEVNIAVLSNDATKSLEKHFPGYMKGSEVDELVFKKL